MNDLQFELARDEDLCAIVDIYNSTIALRTVTADTEPVSVESRRAWFAAHDAHVHPLWMVRRGDRMAGWISYSAFYGRPAYRATAEVSIYLHPDERGRGLGRQCLEFALARAPALGLENVLGFVFAENAPSVRLFTQCGFEAWGTLPRVARIDDGTRDLLILGRRVAAIH
jgi:L-amino acid N-acyltransferase YncA